MTEFVRLQSTGARAIGHPNGCVREPGVRRRNVLGLLAVGVATFVRPPGPRPGGRVVVGHTQLPSPNTTWQAFAVTPTRAVVLMQNLPRTGLAARDGAVQLASTTVRTGTARLTVPMASGSTALMAARSSSPRAAWRTRAESIAAARPRGQNGSANATCATSPSRSK